ncbi:peptidylprolyl isomerase [Ignavibacterium sp.]|uniref:peptidylprolyl isomerase n=1 Tax=Ignavibacterium sp. TaxID=2651167 RepID=UPI00307F0F81
MNLSKKNKLIIFFIALYKILSCASIELKAQDEQLPLAKVGSEIITVDEFKDRYEFMPHLNYSSDNVDTLKKEFLYSLIAERLWALEALERRMDTLDIVKQSLQTLEKLFVKDELFRNEVENKIQLSSEELSKGLIRVPRILYVHILTSTDSIEIYSLYNSLLEGKNFDSILVNRSEFNTQQKPFQIKLGTLSNELAEDLVFNLKLNDFSIPIKSDSKWYLFKVVNEEIDSTLFNNNETARNRTITILKERKRKIIAGRFLDSLLGGRTVTADNELFTAFTDELVQVLNERISKSIADTNKIIDLTSGDLNKALHNIDKNKLNTLFVKFDDIELTLKDFIYYLMYQKVSFTSLKPNRIKYVINSIVKQFIEDEIITAVGYKKKLNFSHSVQKELNMWRNYYLSEIMMNKFADSVIVTDSDIENYLLQKSVSGTNELMLNIVEILTNNLDDMMIVLDELKNGKNFRELTKHYNQRTYTKESDGEWGYFLAKSAGEIGKAASNLNLGEIYGPIRVKEGYSIFQLIDKKVVPDSLIKISEEPKEYIKIKLALSKINSLINLNTKYLSEKYGVEINEQLLGNIQLSPLNMFTYKLIGFGGKIAAMPITIPAFEWYYLRDKSEIP